MKEKTTLATWQMIFWLVFIPLLGLLLMFNVIPGWKCGWRDRTKVIVTIAAVLMIAVRFM